MASIGVVMNSTGLDGLSQGVGGRTKKELSLAVRDNLAIIERRHKTKEIKRGGRGRAVKSKWTSRTGALSKSFHRDWKKGRLYGAYGSDLARSEKVEEGGTIHAKKKYLAIPTSSAPKGVWPRHMTGLFFIMSKKGNPLLVKSGGKGLLEVMFILKRSVTLPPRPALRRAIKATEKDRDESMFTAMSKGIGGDPLAK